MQTRTEGPQTDRRRRWPRGLAYTFALAATLPIAPASAELAGESLARAIAALENRGLLVLYSSDLVRPWMKVAAEPAATEPAAVLQEILQPHGLATRAGPDGMLLVVRARVVRGEAPRRDDPPPLTAAVTPLEEVVVATSRYRLDTQAAWPISLDSADIARLPVLGDDPLRATTQLPGAAAGDFSAKANLRGGEGDETLVRFDGLRLFNPFHFKDFQSLFSTIDPAIVRGIEVYTGGFPASFGDRMSGVISIDSLAAANAPQREVALTLYNASARFAQPFAEGRGEWLLSGRRSNLETLLDLADEDRGAPGYTDLYGRVAYQLTDALGVTASALRFDDDLELNDTDFEEIADATYRDAYYWLRLDYEPGPALHGSVFVARSELDSDRAGSVDQEGIASGTLEDTREFSIDSVQTDWSFSRSDALAFALGGEWRRMRGSYEYQDEVAFDVLFDTPGAPQEATRERNLAVNPSGDQVGLYASVRAQPAATFVADVGLRWDHESLSQSGHETWSPRANLLWMPGERMQLRAAWGRYYQAQAVNELQVPDGVTEFSPPQRADHWVAGLEYRHPEAIDLRLEFYQKEYHQLRARFENMFNSAVLLPELKPDRVLIAPESARARGLELSVSRRTESPLDWWFAWSWAEVTDELPDTSSRRSWDQSHAIGAGLVWHSGGWELTLAGRYHSGWPTTALELASLEPVALVVTGPRNAERLGDYRSVDVRVARVFDLDRAGELTAFLEITNLFNENNECCVDYDISDEVDPPVLEADPGYYLPLLPSIGFIWRF